MSFKAAGNVAAPVLPGDTLGAAPPGSAAHAGPGCHLAGGVFIADAYGLVRVREDEVSVTPLAVVDADRLHVNATLYATDHLGREVDAAAVGRVLRTLRIAATPDAAAIGAALAQAHATGGPVPVVIARGQPVVHGVDGRFDVEVDLSASPGEVRDDGTIDFHERHLVHSVKKGQLLGRLVPPVRGTPGRDVFGALLTPREARAASVAFGANVLRDADGTVRAAADGMLVQTRGALAVTTVLELPGDVGYATGHLRGAQGSVSVKGGIRTGFTVQASGNVIVGELVGGADVDAGGDVVARGIGMHGKGRVRAGGRIRALYAENARLVADGDLEIANDLVNCEVRTGGRLVATAGKGRVLACAVWCAGGCEVNELGSELGAPTTIVLGPVNAERTRLEARRKDLEEGLHRLEIALGPATSRPAAHAHAGQQHQRDEVTQELANVVATLHADDQRFAALDAARVRVKRAAHQGTVIVIGGVTRTLAATVGPGEFKLDATHEAVVFEAK